MKPTVSAIGSCRVFTPVNRLAQAGLVQANHKGVEWYTHSTRDCLQKLKIVQNALVLDELDVPLVVESMDGKWHPSSHNNDYFKPTDIYVIEICSRKIYSRNGIYYQQWCVDGDIGKKLSPEVRARAAECKIIPHSREGILEDLKRICDRLGKPVIFVGHLATQYRGSKVFEDRKFIIDTLMEFCESDSRASYFDPRILVELYGEDAALMDSAHYNDSFYRVIGNHLFFEISRRLHIEPSGEQAKPGASEPMMAIS